MELRNVMFDVFKHIKGDLYDVIGFDGHCNSYEARAIVRNGVVREIFAETLRVYPFRFGLYDNLDLIDDISRDLKALSNENLKQAI